MTRQEAAHQLAGWLASTHPDLFLAAYHVATFGATPQTPGLGDISDFLTSIGDNVSNAVSSVGDWLSNSANITALTGLASTYLTTSTQKSVLQSQLARVQGSQAPLAIQYTANGAAVIPVTAAGTPVVTSSIAPQIVSYVPATQSVLSQFTPTQGWSAFVQANIMPLSIAAVVVGLYLIVRR